MRTKKYMVVVAIAASAAICLCACSSKEELSTSRAYREAIPEDYVPMTDAGEFITDGYVIPEADRMSMFEAFEILNTIRQDEGLKPLKWNGDLESDAIKRAEELTAKFDHTRPDGQYWYTVDPAKVLGENIYGGSEHADMVMDSWMKNQPDRENFLCDEFTMAAIAVFRDAEDTCYWTCEFGDDSSEMR